MKCERIKMAHWRNGKRAKLKILFQMVFRFDSGMGHKTTGRISGNIKKQHYAKN